MIVLKWEKELKHKKFHMLLKPTVKKIWIINHRETEGISILFVWIFLAAQLLNELGMFQTINTQLVANSH